jgi:hypothetical protein
MKLRPERPAAGDPLLLDGRQFAALFAALALIALVPILVTNTLPLVDYHNHLARMHVLSALSHSETLQRYYEAPWTALPNLAMDLAVPLLAKWMPVELASKVFVALSLCMLAGGAAALHRVLFGKWSAWPLLAFLLLFNRSLLWGLLNYLFGIGAALLAFSAWIALSRRPRLRLALGTAMALALFFAHLMAFGFYGIMVIGYEAGAILRNRPSVWRALRTLIPAGATFLPGLAVLLLLTPGGGSGAVEFNHLGRKIELLFSVFDNYHTAFDLVCFLLVLLAGAFAFWKKWISLHPAAAVPLALVFLAYLIMPAVAASSTGADRRVPLLLGLLLVAGSRWTAANANVARAFAAAALVLFLVRMGVVTAEWRQSGRTYSELLPAFDRIPHGSRVILAAPGRAEKWEPTPLHHFPVLAVLYRDAFVSTLFANPSQQPVLFRPHYRALADKLGEFRLWDALAGGAAPLDASERAALAEYDFVIFEAPQPFTLPRLNGIAPIVTTPRFVLARIDPVLIKGDPAMAAAASDRPKPDVAAE